MKLHLNNPAQYNLILSCDRGPDGFRIRIGEAVYEESLVLTPDDLNTWSVSSVADIQSSHFEQLANLQAEVVILGTGDTITFPESKLTRPLIDQGIGLEVMDTMAACRTYNILRGDDRKVAAAIIL